eukprot:Nk52_evm57s1020 gene=Nk52_evmTU57s1020
MNVNHETALVDELIKEYLLYRGFGKTLKTFENDIKTDINRSYNTGIVVDALFDYVSSYDLDGLTNYWNTLDASFFCKLDFSFIKTTQQLKIGIDKYYITHALKHGKKEEVISFFKHVNRNSSGPCSEWKDWYGILFVESPQKEALYQPYFTEEWVNTLKLSLGNFLETIFSSMPRPVLLEFLPFLKNMRKLEEENEALHEKMGEYEQMWDNEGSGTDGRSFGGFSNSCEGSIHSQESPSSSRKNRRPSANLSHRKYLKQSSFNGSDQNIASAMRVQTKGPVVETVVKASGCPIRLVSFSRNGSIYACVDFYNVLRVFEVNATSPFFSLKCQDKLTCLEWDISDAERLYIGGDQGKLRMLCPRKPNESKTLSARSNFKSIMDIAGRPCSCDVFIVCATEAFQGSVVFKFERDQMEESVEEELQCVRSPTYVTCLAISSDGLLGVFGCSDGSIRLISLEDYSCVFIGDVSTSNIGNVGFFDDTYSFFAVDISELLACWSATNGGDSFDLTLRATTLANCFCEKQKRAFLKASKGELLFTSSRGNSAVVYHLPHLKPLGIIGSCKDVISCLDCSSSVLVLGCEDGNLYFYEAEISTASTHCS